MIMAATKSATKSAPPAGKTNLPATEQGAPKPVEKIDFTAGKSAGTWVKATKHIPLSMLTTKGLEVPRKLQRGRVERGTLMCMSKTAAAWLIKLKYGVKSDPPDDL